MIAHRILASPNDPTHTLVLVHAFPLSSKMWDAAATALQELREDTRVIGIDLPGFGDAPFAESWSMESVATQLHNRLSELGFHNVVLAGLSLGGYVSLQYYRAYGAALSGLILSDTKAAEDTEAQKRLRSQFAADALKRGPQAAIERLYGGFVTERTDPGTAAQIEEWMLSAPPKAIAAALIAMRDRSDSTDLLPILSVPTLVVVGERDNSTTPAMMREMAKQLPDSTFEVIPDVAHLSAVENPELWASIVSSFLDRLAE